MLSLWQICLIEVTKFGEERKDKYFCSGLFHITGESTKYAPVYGMLPIDIKEEYYAMPSVQCNVRIGRMKNKCTEKK